MEEIFASFPKIFHNSFQQPQRQQHKLHKPDAALGGQSAQPLPRTTQCAEIEQSAQHHPEQHKHPQLSAADDAAQQKEQHRRQNCEQQLRRAAQARTAAPPHEGLQEVIHQPQQHAAAHAEQRLQPLRPGVDPHQPRILPKRPRPFPPLSA